MKRDKEEAKLKGLDKRELTEEDYIEYAEMLEDRKAEDAKIEVEGGVEEDEFTEPS